MSRYHSSNTAAPASPSLADWVRLVVLGLIWGASFLSISVSLTGFGPFSVAAYRVALAALVLVGIALAMGAGLPSLKQGRIWLHVAGMGLFSNALPFTLLGFAQQSVPSAFAGISMAAVPLLVLPLAHLFLPGERLSLWKALGVTLGFAGVGTLIGWGAIAQAGGDTAARVACLGAAGCYAIGSIITRACPPVHPLAFSAGGLLSGSLMILPVALAMEGLPTSWPLGPSLAVLYLALGPTALATILLVQVIQSAGPGFMSLVNYQVPIWSVLFGVTLLHETLPPSFLTALLLILAGLALSQTGQKRLGRYPSG